MIPAPTLWVPGIPLNALFLSRPETFASAMPPPIARHFAARMDEPGSHPWPWRLLALIALDGIGLAACGLSGSSRSWRSKTEPSPDWSATTVEARAMMRRLAADGITPPKEGVYQNQDGSLRGHLSFFPRYLRPDAACSRHERQRRRFARAGRSGYHVLGTIVAVSPPVGRGE